jgi:hypothetical protein
MFVMSLEAFQDTVAWFWASDCWGPPALLMCEQLAGSLTRRRLQNGLSPLSHAVNVLYLINRNCACSVPRPTHFCAVRYIRQDSL